LANKIDYFALEPMEMYFASFWANQSALTFNLSSVVWNVELCSV